MSLFEVLHQAHAQRHLQRAVDADRTPHAYLFHGPDGVGKERLALGLAELLLCPQPVTRDVDPAQVDAVGLGKLRGGCGTCEDCRSTATQSHPDLHLIYRQLNREHPDALVRKRKALDIGVDVLRHFVIDKVVRTPLRGRAKVFIVREADRITASAQNALLKTLEEPPGATFIILLAQSLDKLLPTTLSRCQVVTFDALPSEFVRAVLVTQHPDLSPERASWCARRADGSVGRAVEAAGDDLYELNERMIPRFRTLAGDGPGDLGPGKGAKVWIDESKKLAERYRKRDPEITDTEFGRRALKTIFQLASIWYADVMRVGSGQARCVANEAHLAVIEQSARSLSPERAIDAINRLALAEYHLDRNANVQLTVEVLLNDLASIGKGSLV